MLSMSSLAGVTNCFSFIFRREPHSESSLFPARSTKWKHLQSELSLSDIFITVWHSQTSLKLILVVWNACKSYNQEYSKPNNNTK